VRVVAISPDQPQRIAAQVSESPALGYTFLSDADATAMRAFGLAFKVDAATTELYRGYGIDIDAASGRDHHLLPVPAVYLVDRDGVVRFAHWDPDYTKRLSGDELTLAAMSAR